MEKCARCKVRIDQVKLFEVIYEGGINLFCERCSIIENIPIISKPDSEKIKESERGYGVYERLKRLSGLMPEAKKETTMLRSERLKELDMHPELESSRNKSIDLIEHFHWEIMKCRRRKGLSQEKLSEILKVPVSSIESLERGIVTDNSIPTINKLEQFFQIKIRKTNYFDETEELPKPILLDKFGHKLEHIPEPDITNSNEEDNNEVVVRSGDLDIRKINTSSLTIKELREMHRRKIDVTKQEKREEQKRIEARNHLIEARKEELRLSKEKESKELDNLLGGSELLTKEDNSDIDLI